MSRRNCGCRCSKEADLLEEDTKDFDDRAGIDAETEDSNFVEDERDKVRADTLVCTPVTALAAVAADIDIAVAPEVAVTLVKRNIVLL